jgi:hypothetical protein
VSSDLSVPRYQGDPGIAVRTEIGVANFAYALPVLHFPQYRACPCMYPGVIASLRFMPRISQQFSQNHNCYASLRFSLNFLTLGFARLNFVGLGSRANFTQPQHVSRCTFSYIIVPYNSCWITGHTTNSSDYSIVADFRTTACNWVTIVPHNSHRVLESCLTIQRLFDSGSIAEQQHIIKRLLWGTILAGIWGDGLNPATIVGYDSYRNMGWWLEFPRLSWGTIVAGFWHGTLISSDYDSCWVLAWHYCTPQ